MRYRMPDGIPDDDQWPPTCIWWHDDRKLNFSWVDEYIAGSGCPEFTDDLRFLQEQGITALVGIWENGKAGGPNKRKVAASGIEHFLREPVDDYRAPSVDQLARIFESIDRVVAQGHKVAVACGYGEGRTGTVLACYFVWRGMTPSQAIRTMLQKQRIPYENQDQRDRILSYRPNNDVLNSR